MSDKNTITVRRARRDVVLRKEESHLLGIMNSRLPTSTRIRAKQLAERTIRGREGAEHEELKESGLPPFGKN